MIASVLFKEEWGIVNLTNSVINVVEGLHSNNIVIAVVKEVIEFTTLSCTLVFQCSAQRDHLYIEY